MVAHAYNPATPEWRLGELQFKATRAKSDTPAGCQWLTFIILATQEAEIKRIEV
jgi:hypothetical protein